MNFLKSALRILGLVALMMSVGAISVSLAAPDKKAVALKKKQSEAAKNRARAAQNTKPVQTSKSKNADKVKLTETQTKEIEDKRTASAIAHEEVIAQQEEVADGESIQLAFGSTEKGQKLYKACSVCHGNDGKKVSPGQLEGHNILSRDFEDLVKELVAYREGTANNGGLEVIMTANMEGWTDEEIIEVSKYVMELAAKYGNDASANTKQTARKGK